MAKKDKGWIKLYRKLTENPIWTSGKEFDERSAWIDLLLMVNHEPRVCELRSGKVIEIESGQCHTSMDNLAKRWKWGRNRVIRYFRRLSAQHMCNIVGTPDGTTITVVNWGKFQGGRTSNRTADETMDGTMGGTRTRIYKELNNKNVEEGADAHFGSVGGYDVE